MNTIEEVFKKPGTVLGTWVTMTDPTVIEFAKLAGFDFVRLDNEYFPFDINMIEQMIRTANSIGLPIIVRVSRLEDISMFISCGADGIMIPDGTYERAKETVERVKYAPLGKRSMFMKSRAVRVSGLNFKEYHKQANNHVSVTVQIEDPKGMADIDKILSLEGVDFVASGRADISQVLSVPGETDHPKVDEFEDAVIKKALEYKKIPMLMVAPNKAAQEKLLQKGVHVMVICSDYEFMFNGMQAAIKEMRK